VVVEVARVTASLPTHTEWRGCAALVPVGGTRHATRAPV